VASVRARGRVLPCSNVADVAPRHHAQHGLEDSKLESFASSVFYFVEGSLDEDRLRCTLLPDGIVGKIKCAFSFKNSGSKNLQFVCCFYY
jgi:hypothetical protein